MKLIFLSAAAASLGFALPAAAQVPIPGTGLSVSGEAELMSDYRFRGVSRSDEDPAAGREDEFTETIPWHSVGSEVSVLY